MKPTASMHRHRRWLAPVSTLVLLALLSAALAIPYRYKLGQYEQGVQSLAPRIERMLGLLTASPELALRQQEYQQALDRLSYPPEREAEGMQNDLSTRLRQAVEGSGLTLSSLAPQSVKPQDGLDKYPVSLSVQGNLLQLQVFLDSLNQGPRLWTESLTIRQGRGAGDGSQNISAEITVVAVRRAKS